MAKISKHIEVPMEEIMEMIQVRYLRVHQDRHKASPF